MGALLFSVSICAPQRPCVARALRCETGSAPLIWNPDALSREDWVMKQIGMAIAVAAAVLIGPARADEPTPDTEGGHYVFSKQATGFLRLDTRSGVVSLCTEQPVGWACQTAPEDRAVFENEIARLQSENAALKKVLLAHGLSLPPSVTAESSGERNEPTLRLPSDADIDQVIAFVSRVWQRFVDTIARAQKQMFNKS